MQRFPILLRAEYRGTEPARQFAHRETGENITIPPKLRFEWEGEDGDLELLSVSQSQFDRLPGAAELVQSLTRGDFVELIGRAVIQSRGSDADSYVQFTGITAVEL